MDRLDSLGSETGYLGLERPAEWSKPLSADMLQGKAKRTDEVVRQEPRFVEALNAWSAGQAWPAPSV
jgi:hypothetical protein